MANNPCKPGVDIEFGKVGDASLNASICQFELKLPNIPFPPKLSLNLPFPPPFPPKFKFQFALSCDPSNPIDITAGLEWGGGRKACFDTDPEQESVQ